MTRDLEGCRNVVVDGPGKPPNSQCSLMCIPTPEALALTLYLFKPWTEHSLGPWQHEVPPRNV